MDSNSQAVGNDSQIEHLPIFSPEYNMSGKTTGHVRSDINLDPNPQAENHDL